MGKVYPEDDTARSLTGARRDSSLLFNLSHLGRLARTSGVVIDDSGAASGLWDIVPPRASEPTRSEAHDIPAMPLPSLPAPTTNRRPSALLMALSATTALLCAAAVWSALSHRGQEPGPGSDPVPAVVAQNLPTEPSTVEIQPATRTTPEPAAEPMPAKATETAEPKVATRTRATTRTRRGPARRPRRVVRPRSATPTSEPKTIDKPAPVEVAKPAEPKPADDPLSRLIAGFEHNEKQKTGQPKPKAEPKPAVADRANLTPSEVKAGMKRTGLATRLCFARYKVSGIVMARVTISPTGHVTTSSVKSPFAGTPTGDCVAKALAAATFPTFNGPAFSILYPVVLR